MRNLRNLQKEVKNEVGDKMPPLPVCNFRRCAPVYPVFLRSLRFVATLRVPFGLPAADCLRSASALLRILLPLNLPPRQKANGILAGCLPDSERFHGKLGSTDDDPSLIFLGYYILFPMTVFIRTARAGMLIWPSGE